MSDWYELPQRSYDQGSSWWQPLREEPIQREEEAQLQSDYMRGYITHEECVQRIRYIRERGRQQQSAVQEEPKTSNVKPIIGAVCFIILFLVIVIAYFLLLNLL